MSCVAENSAIRNSTAMHGTKKCAIGTTDAASANAAKISICITTVHCRFVKFTSTNGPQNSLNGQGSATMLVQNVMRRLSTPKFLKTLTKVSVTRMLGIDCMK